MICAGAPSQCLKTALLHSPCQGLRCLSAGERGRGGLAVTRVQLMPVYELLRGSIQGCFVRSEPAAGIRTGAYTGVNHNTPGCTRCGSLHQQSIPRTIRVRRHRWSVCATHDYAIDSEYPES